MYPKTPRVPDAVQRAALAERCTADPGPPKSAFTRVFDALCRNGPGSAAHHFVLRCARDTKNE